MFSNFKKSFNKDNEQIVVPKEVLLSLSEKLPSNLLYEDIGKGVCVVNTKSSEMNLKINLALPDNFKPKSTSELFEYMYRTQSEIKVIPDKDGNVVINDSKISLKDLVTYPFTDDEIEGDMYLVPPPFRPPFKLLIEGDGMSQEVLIQRQPYGDMNKSLFKTVQDNIFDITYIVDETSETINFNININIEKSNSASEILTGLIIYQAFLCGRGIFAGLDLSKYSSKNGVEDISKTIEFWNKIKILEELLNVKFNINFPITIDDAKWVDKLYLSFVNKIPYRENININKLNTTSKEPIKKDTFSRTNELMISFIQRSDLILWEAHIDLFDVVAIFNIQVLDVIKVKDKDEYEIKINSVENKKMYLACRHFISEESASLFVKEVEQLQKAKPLEEL